MKRKRRTLSPRLRSLALLLPMLALCSCEEENFGEANFYENVYDAYADCRESEIRFLKGKQGISTAFAECGSNNFGAFSWSPSGIHLYFLVTHAGHVLNGEDKTIATVPTPLPVTNGVWLDADRILLLLPHQEAGVPGQRIAVYDHRKATMTAVDTGLELPTMLQRGPDMRHAYVTALDDQGARRPYSLDITSGEVERAFPWLDAPLESFTFEPDAAGGGMVTWASGGVAHIARSDGSERRDFEDALRASIHPGGRWLILERLGTAVSNFDQASWDEMTDEARERAVRRRDAWVERLPDWTETETRPPSMDLVDLDSGARYRFSQFQGDMFEWYRAADYWVSFRLWGIEEKELNANVALLDLQGRMREIERGSFPKGIELVQAMPAAPAGEDEADQAPEVAAEPGATPAEPSL
jgi:hypothetical protein